MLKIKGVDHLNLNVQNLEKTVAWYRDIFGFEVKEEGLGSTGNKYKIIGKPRALYLALYETKTKDEVKSDLNHFGINIEDFSESVKRLNEKGVEILYGGVIDYEKSQSVYIKDPNGNEIELSSNFGGGLN